MQTQTQMTYTPASIEEAAQISAALGLVGITYTYNGGRGATAGILDGTLRETRFGASFPNDSLLPHPVVEAILELRSEERMRQAKLRQADRYPRSSLNGDNSEQVTRSKEALREALVAAYGDL